MTMPAADLAGETSGRGPPKIEPEEPGTNTNVSGPREELKMHESVLWNDKRNDSEESESVRTVIRSTEKQAEITGTGGEKCDLKISGEDHSLTTEVPIIVTHQSNQNQSRANPNSKPAKTILRLNGLNKAQPVINESFGSQETNGSLQQLLMLDSSNKRNGGIAPSLNEPKTPLIVVKTVTDLNNVSNTKPKNGERKFLEEKSSREEEEKIKEYLKRGDTAVIYQEPVDQKNKGIGGILMAGCSSGKPGSAGLLPPKPPFSWVIYRFKRERPPDYGSAVPLSPAAVKALTEAEVSNPDYFFKCLHCQKAYLGLQALRDHIEADHIGNMSPNEALSPVQGSYSPVPVPVQGGLHACPQCNVSFSTKDQLEKHELLHSPNAQVSCKVCNKQFANVYRLQRHMISHDESAVLRKFKCPECEKAFKFKHHLKEHIRIHSGEKPFECANCGKRFSHSGSYSSHMTSKKCLVMNLKVNRGRGAGLDKAQINRNVGGGSKRNVTNNNNNCSSNNNNNINSLKGNLNLSSSNMSMPPNNSFPGMMPKYGDPAAAFFSAAAPRSNFPSPSAPGLHPFYMATAPTMHLNSNAMRAYGIPALSHFLEQFATPSSMMMSPKKERDEFREEKQQMLQQQHREQEEEEEEEESKGEEDEEEEEAEVKKDIIDSKEDDNESRTKEVKMEKSDDEREATDYGSAVGNCGGDLEAVKRILETVNATVTKQFLHANMQKFTSSPSGSSCASVPSPTMDDKRKQDVEEFECRHCGKSFQNAIDQHRHERYSCETLQKSEGLAAKLEEVASGKGDDNLCSGSEDEDAKECEEEIERNEDGGITITTTTQEGGADGRKVRVRSLIADEQLAILKHHYLINPRPKREELSKIADKIGFPVRVVQVWFQNTRARDRREGRLVQVPYLPIPSLFPSNVPLMHPNVTEQPLDLSVKKFSISSPDSSPRRNKECDVLNLSRKSTSPNPHTFPNGLTIRPMPGFPQYHHSSCTSSSSSSLRDFRKTPSPLAYLNLHQEDLKSGCSKLARILTKPNSQGGLDPNGISLVPTERLVFNPDLQNSASPLPVVALSLLKQENGRASSSSPGSDKRSWVQGDLTDETEDSRPHDVEHGDDFASRAKKSKFQQDSQSDPEAEGQFICDQCDKAFSKQSSLARHKYEHSGQRPHKCEVCEKAFKHKHHLTEHKRLHSGEKPFQCGKCLKRFSHSGSYSQHMNHRYSYCKPYRD